MTLPYAERIVEAVRVDDPSFSVADLGAPQSVVVEVEPAVLDRLEALEAGVALLATQEEVREGLETLRAAIDRLANRGTDEGRPAAGSNG